MISFVLSRPVASVSVSAIATADPDPGPGPADPDPDPEPEPPECYFDFQSFAQTSATVDYVFEDLAPLPLTLIPTRCTPESFEHVVFNEVRAYSEEGELLDSVVLGSAEGDWEFRIADTTEESRRLIDHLIDLE